MERTNLFIQASPDLFQDCPEVETIISTTPPVTADQIVIRRERQTFTRLPKSGAICFTVRTFMRPLSEYGGEELSALRSQVEGWEEEIREYKGWAVWGEALMGRCEERLGKWVPPVRCEEEVRKEKREMAGRCMG